MLRTESGEVRARAVVIASGVAYRSFGSSRIEELVGLGVHYGAAMTAAREMEDQDVYVVGGGNSAGQAAVHLARFARSVTILVRRPDLAETMSSYLIGEIEYNPRIIDPDLHRCGRRGGDGGRLEWLCLEDVRTGDRTHGPGVAACSCCSVRSRTATGSRRPSPATSVASCSPGVTSRATAGSTDCRRRTSRRRCPASLPPATSRSGSMKRVASASGEGASVVPLVHSSLSPAVD